MSVIGFMKEHLKSKPFRWMWDKYDWIMSKIRAGVHRCKRSFYRQRMRAKTTKWQSYGENNKDKRFIVLSSPGENGGLFSSLFYLLCIFEYAKKKKYIPVVDWKNSFLPSVQDAEKKGLENAWDYFYEQPNDKYSLEEVYQSKRVIRMTEYMVDMKKSTLRKELPFAEENLNYWNRIICAYIKPNAHMEQQIAEARSTIFEQGKKVLGVGIRAQFRWGQMIQYSLFDGHPVVTTCEEYLSIIADRLSEWKCDYLFLACDDREYWQKFVDFFGEKCKYIPRILQHHFHDDIPYAREEYSQRLVEFEGTTVRQRAEEYMVETYLLAECDSLYSCMGGGAQFAYLLNSGKYEHLEFYNHGRIEIKNS